MVDSNSIESEESAQRARAARTGGVARRRWRAALAIVGLTVVCLLGLRAAGVIGPRPCLSCHDQGAFRAQTQASPHAGVDCRRCHVPSGPVAEAVFVLQRPLHAYVPRTRAADREAAAVPDERCVSCHKDDLQGVVVLNGISINHASCAKTASCTDCHSATAHGEATKWVRSYDMDACLECHMASDNIKCDLCHQGRSEVDRVKFAAFSVTHGTKWRTTHGMGDAATCIVCHTASDCADCHGAGVPHESNFVTVHSSYAGEEDARCETCHKEVFCYSCHGVQMPHPAGFTPRHPALSKAKPHICSRCHAKSDCTTCHEMHVHPGGAIGTDVSAGGEQ